MRLVGRLVGERDLEVVDAGEPHVVPGVGTLEPLECPIELTAPDVRARHGERERVRIPRDEGIERPLGFARMTERVLDHRGARQAQGLGGALGCSERALGLPLEEQQQGHDLERIRHVGGDLERAIDRLVGTMTRARISTMKSANDSMARSGHGAS